MDFLTFAKKTVAEAAKIALRDYGHSEVTYKDPTQIVTKTDVEVERLITDAIKKEFPDHSILGEESGRSDGKSDYCWYIDPIDGTTNFAYRIPLWGISLALFKDGKPLLGVVAIPVLDETMYAEKGKGAFCNGKRMTVNPAASIKNGLVLTCPNPNKYPEHIRDYIDSLSRTPGLKVRSLGCCVANMHSIAMGASIAYFDRELSIYDYAAGALIVEEAGGRVTDFSGKPWWESAQGNGSFILATNGKVHEEVLKKIR